jgi:hypothetical protein
MVMQIGGDGTQIFGPGVVGGGAAALPWAEQQMHFFAETGSIIFPPVAICWYGFRQVNPPCARGYGETGVQIGSWRRFLLGPFWVQECAGFACGMT